MLRVFAKNEAFETTKEDFMKLKTFNEALPIALRIEEIDIEITNLLALGRDINDHSILTINLIHSEGVRANSSGYTGVLIRPLIDSLLNYKKEERKVYTNRLDEI